MGERAILKYRFVDRPFPGGTAVVGEISGSIDANTLPEFRKKIQAFQEKGRKYILLKSEGLRYVNSSGLGALIKIATDLRQEGGVFMMTELPDKILSLFKMLGILDVVQVHATEEDALMSLAAPAAPAAEPRPEFPLFVRCITCRRKIELSAPGYFRCPRCGTCFSVKSDAKVKGYQIDTPQIMELKLPCQPDAAPAIHEALAGLARLKQLPKPDLERVRAIVEKACTLAFEGASPEERLDLYLVADRKEFRAAMKAQHAAFQDSPLLREIRPLADEMEVISLPAGAQILKFSRTIRRAETPAKT